MFCSKLSRGRGQLTRTITPAIALVAMAGAVAPLPSLFADDVRVNARSADKVTITVEKAQPKPADAAKPGQPHTCVVAPPEPPVKSPFAGQRPAVDLAILLDTSSSMSGLIDQAKQQIWTIVNQFAKAQKSGQTPILRVAVFQYGNNGLPASEGYIRQMVPLTDNLDEVSAALFALTTNGGSEYCGQVIDEAVKSLDWSSEPNAYKAIFIAGNEPFTQGPVTYHDAGQAAVGKGIVINTIHCGDYDTGISGQWHMGAKLAEGEYMNIDHDRKVVHITAPQDKVIIELNQKLNRTYIWYGKKDQREALREQQVAQDANAAKLNPTAALSRAEAKASGAAGAYRNVGRDLVDSFEADADVLSEVADDALPAEMQGMDAEQRQAHVEKIARERAAIQAQIQTLTAERNDYVAAERARQAEGGGEATLGDAVNEAVGKQLKEAGFEVKAE